MGLAMVGAARRIGAFSRILDCRADLGMNDPEARNIRDVVRREVFIVRLSGGN